MALDTSSLHKAIGQLAQGLEEARAEPGRDLLRDGVIQRFEYTYELSHKLLRRFLEQTEPSPDQLDGSSFADLIRLGSERGILRNGWDVWRTYRTARGTTSHTCDSAKARQVFALVPAFLEDAQALLDALITGPLHHDSCSGAASRAQDHRRGHLAHARPRPCRIWAFGSRARDAAKPFSDLDLAIDVGRALTLAETGNLAWAFEESELPWRVDLLDLAACSDPFRREVESHAVPLLELP